ncbi:hypothetical protein FACS1894195_3980 [Bacteroidia bacterium]|nr:hypothetical protein FACS1894195_3980 [Bacteroidia bacterium]
MKKQTTAGKIYIRNEHEMCIIPPENLIKVTVEDYLCTFFIENEDKFVCTKSLKELEAILPDFFIRISRNCIINKNKVKSMDSKKQTVKMSDNQSLPFSSRNAKRLKDLFQDKKNNRGKNDPIGNPMISPITKSVIPVDSTGTEFESIVSNPIENPIDRLTDTERNQKILELIIHNTSISTRDMAKRFNVQRATIRKFLDTLKMTGVIKRIGCTRGYWKVNNQKIK